MEVYRHFNLAAAPFEGRPDPAFFFGAPAHAEALATLRYAFYAGKACVLVVGDVGSGKTLLGRLLVEEINRSARILWVHGLGQSPGDTQLKVYPAGAFDGSLAVLPPRVETTTLAEWMRTASASSAATLLIVDDADGLHRRGWEDLLALVTQELQPAHAPTLVLLGLPSIVQLLSLKKLARLRRRVFRTCALRGLARNETEAYVQHRIATAHGSAAPFTAEALDAIQHLSGGNPALINQICDSALIDAFGEDRHSIDAPHIGATVRAITGGLNRRRTLPGSPWTRLSTTFSQIMPEDTRVLAEPPRLAAPSIIVGASLPGETEHTPPFNGEIDATAWPPEPGGSAADSTPLAGAVSTALADRLRSVAQRLTVAVSRVREARVRSCTVAASNADVRPESRARAADILPAQ